MRGGHSFSCQLTQSKHSQITPEVCLIGNQNGFFSLGIIMQIPTHTQKSDHFPSYLFTLVRGWKAQPSSPERWQRVVAPRWIPSKFHVTATLTAYGTYWWFSVNNWQLLCKHQKWQKAIKTYTGTSHLFFPNRQKVSLLTGCQFPQAGHSLLKMLLINFHLYCSIDVPME